MKTNIRNTLLSAMLAIGLGVPYLHAADVAISALPAGTTLVGNEYVPAVQSGATVKIQPAAILTYIIKDSATTEVLYNNAGALDGDAGFTFNDTTNIATLTGGIGLGGSADVFIVRAAAGSASFRNGTTAQTVRVTDTYTDDSNNAYLELNAAAAGDWLQVRGVTNGTAGDNYSVALTPTGTGAVSAQVPDSTTTGGNARGANAVDWQQTRSSATSVASGLNSVVSGGSDNAASSDYATVSGGVSNVAASGNSVVAGGNSNYASGNTSTISGGSGNVASATFSIVSGGNSNVASGAASWIPGGVGGTTRGLYGAYAYAAGWRAAAYDSQVIGQPVRRTTTDATPVSLATDGTPAATTVMVLPSDSTATCRAMVTANSTSAGVVSMAGFDAIAIVKNDSSTITVSGGTCTAIGTADAALTTATCALVANGTLDSIEMQVTGVAATTVYWVAEVKCVQAL